MTDTDGGHDCERVSAVLRLVQDRVDQLLIKRGNRHPLVDRGVVVGDAGLPRVGDRQYEQGQVPQGPAEAEHQTGGRQTELDDPTISFTAAM